MMSHQAGLPYLDAELGFDDAMAVTPMVEALAAQAPIWEPGTKHGYHAVTYGWLAGELVRRVDGRTLGQLLRRGDRRHRSASSSGSVCPSRRSHGWPRLEAVPPPEDPNVAALMEQFMGPGTIAWKALTVNGALTTGPATNAFNTRAVHATEMPAANGITTARSLARMYAATVGPVDGIRLIDDATVGRPDGRGGQRPRRRARVPEPVRHGIHARTAARPDARRRRRSGTPAPADRSATPIADAKVGYGYVMNQMAGGIAGDPRTITLTDAVRACL